MIKSMIIDNIKNLNPFAILMTLSISLLLIVILIDDMIKINSKK